MLYKYFLAEFLTFFLRMLFGIMYEPTEFVHFSCQVLDDSFEKYSDILDFLDDQPCFFHCCNKILNY